MDKRICDFFRSDAGVLFLPAMLLFLLHVATNGLYGFHRDELQTLDDARQLDWGFVVYPPVTPLIGRLELILFGTSLTGFRVFSALAMSAIMVLAGLMAKELGGRRHAQLLTAIAAGIAPVSLIQGAVFQYVSFDYLWGVTVTCFFIRLLKSDDPRWWLAIGGVIGLGMDALHHGRVGSEALLWRPLKRSGAPAGGVERLGWKAQDIRDGFRLVAKTR